MDIERKRMRVLSIHPHSTLHTMHCLPQNLTLFTPTKPLLLPPPNPKPYHIFRRHFFSSSLLLLSIAPDPLRAETTDYNDTNDNNAATTRPFLDISIDGEPIGRIIIGLYSDSVPAGASRFKDLVTGAAGVTYRRKEFIKILPNYVQHGGIRSYGVDAELARKKRGSNLGTESLVDEWEIQNENSKGTRNVAKSVGLIVRNPAKPPPKPKIVARDGKLEIDQEEVGLDPNGTEFVITIKDSPELDSSTLVVGQILQGMEVVERIGQVKTVQENSTSPYFRVAKLIGDKRAVVAERGFNRPYSKVVVTSCGLME